MRSSSAEVVADCRLQCDSYLPYLTVENNQGPSTTHLVKCRHCGVVREQPRPPKSEIDGFYSNEASWTASTDAEGNPRSYVDEIEARMPLYTRLARRIEARKPGGKLLDVGCGDGLLQRAFDASRWDVIGVEPTRFIAEFGKNNLDSNIFVGRFEDFDAPDADFDVIVMKYVLDHAEDPREMLDKSRRLLKDDGLLVIADLINIDSFCARVFQEGFRLIHPLHFTYFSPRTVRLHLAHSGFRVQDIEFPFFETPYWSRETVIDMGKRVAKRVLQLLGRGPGQRVFSPPWYGNMMDVYAVPEIG